jgi:hypothetical protein
MSATVVAAPARTRPAARPALPRRAPQPGRHLRVVPSTRSTRRVFRPAVFAALGTVVLVLALVVAHVLLAQSQLTLDRLNGQVDAARRGYEQARLQQAQLAAPASVIARAATLGLVPPAQPPIAVTVPATPAPGPTR